MTTLSPFTPHRVQLVGHRSLGTVQARRVGCWLEIEYPDRVVTYGPSAVFRVEPVAVPVSKPEPTPPILRWRETILGCWRLYDGDNATSYCAILDRAYVSAAVSVPARSLVEAVGIVAGAARNKGHTVERWPGAPPAPKPEPAPAPAGVVLRGWVRSGPGWRLVTTIGTTIAFVGGDGWTIYTAPLPTGPETGLHGKEGAVERLLADGARWESPAAVTAAMDHDTRAIHRFCAGDVAVMVEGTRRTVEATFGAHMLFSDGTWLSHDAASTAIAARIPADDFPF